MKLRVSKRGKLKPVAEKIKAPAKKPEQFRADADTRAAAKKRRERIFGDWCKGVNASRVAEREGLPLGTVKTDYAFFAKEAADNAETEHKRARAEMLVLNEVADIQADLENADSDDARGRAALHVAKLKAIEHYARINGLLVEKYEHSGRIETGDPRLAGVSDEQLRAALAAVAGSAGASGRGGTPPPDR